MPTPNVTVKQGTDNTGLENSQVLARSVDEELHFFQFEKHPFASLILTEGMSLVQRENSPAPKALGQPLNKKAVSNPKHEWFEDELYRTTFTPTSSVAAGDTSVTVSSGDEQWFRANDVLLLSNSNGQTERVVVTSVSSNTLNIENPDGSTRSNGISMNQDDEFYLMETVRAEDSTAPKIRTTKSDNVYNYLELVSEPYGLTSVKQATTHYTGDQLQLNKRKAYSRFLENLEKMLLFGTRAKKNGSSNPVRHAGGLIYFLELYSDVEIRDMAGSALTKAELNNFLYSVMAKGSQRKVALVDQRVLNVINSFYDNVVSPDNYSLGEFGTNVMKIKTAFGTVKLVHEPLFDKLKPYQGSMMVVDMNDLELLHLEGNGKSLDIQDQQIRLTDGELANKGQWVGMVAPKFNTLKHFGWLKNVGV